MEQLISVIVPIYGVERYLDRCVQSLVNQTYQELEIILVDDGSPDRCPKICDQWGKKDKRIRVLHQENGGLSDARNAGLNMARGEYIGFVDSDDFIHIQMYEKLYRIMQSEHSEIAACGFEKAEHVFEHKLYERKHNGTVISYHTAEALEALITERGLEQVVWNKLYQKDLLDQLLFPHGKYNEDEFWTYQAVARAKKVTVMSYTGYFYFQRPDSIIGETYSLRRLDGLEAREQRQDFVDRQFPRLAAAARLNLFYSYCYACQCSLRSLDQMDRRCAEERIRAGMKKYPLHKSDYRKETVRQKLWIFLYRRSLKGTCRLRNKLKIGL